MQIQIKFFIKNSFLVIWKQLQYIWKGQKYCLLIVVSVTKPKSKEQNVNQVFKQV